MMRTTFQPPLELSLSHSHNVSQTSSQTLLQTPQQKSVNIPQKLPRQNKHHSPRYHQEQAGNMDFWSKR
eukprot:15349136-Ditylum_brightwellii.AAC.1